MVCGDSVARSGTECQACAEQKPYFAKATAYGAYDGALRDLVHLLKYDRVEPAANVLGTMLAKAVQKLNVGAGRFVVVPVPLHVSKRRERGFNQTEIIVRKALKELRLTNLQLGLNALERTRQTASQIGLTRAQRAENMRGAFRVTHLSTVKGQDVLLVDDVLTTGTTASECARVLLKAGAHKVLVATVARTLKKSEEFRIGASEDAGVSTDLRLGERPPSPVEN